MRLLVLPRLAHLEVFPTDRSPARCFRCSRPKKYMKVSFVSSVFPLPLTLRTTPLIKQEPFKLQKSANCFLGPPALGAKPFGDFFFEKEWKLRRKTGTCHPPRLESLEFPPKPGSCIECTQLSKGEKGVSKKKGPGGGGREGPRQRPGHTTGTATLCERHTGTRARQREREEDERRKKWKGDHRHDEHFGRGEEVPLWKQGVRTRRRS